MTNIVVRRAVFDDVYQIVNVVRTGLEPSILQNTIYGCSGIGRYIAEQTKAPHGLADTTYTVATVDGVVASCVEMRLSETGLFLNYISVLPQYRRLGLARKTLLAATRQFADSGRNEMLLDVLADNQVARTWYERLGFVPLKEIEWWHMPNQPVEEAPLGLVSGWPQAAASQENFGFSQLTITVWGGSSSVGRLSDGLFRVTDPHCLSIPSFLATLSKLDPGRKILAIVPAGLSGSLSSAGGQHIATFMRMNVQMNSLLNNLAGSC